MADEQTFKVGDRVRERGFYNPPGIVRGFAKNGKVFVEWDDRDNWVDHNIEDEYRNIGAYQPNQLVLFNGWVDSGWRIAAAGLLDQKQVRL